MEPPRGRRRRRPRPTRGSTVSAASLFLLPSTAALLLAGQPTAGFVIPPTRHGAAASPAATRLHSSIGAGGSAAGNAASTGASSDPASASASASAAAAGIIAAASIAPVPPPVRVASRSSGASALLRQPAPPPPPPTPLLIEPAVSPPWAVGWDEVGPTAPVAGGGQDEGWRAAERRLRALVETGGAQATMVMDACRSLLHACLDDAAGAAEAAAVAWVVHDVLLPRLLKDDGDDVETLGALALRACAVTGAPEAAAALLLALAPEQRDAEGLEWALEACIGSRNARASPALALSLVRAVTGASLTPRALEMAAAAVGNGDAGALRLLIGEVKKKTGVAQQRVPGWLYAQAMRAALEETEAEAAAVVELLYKEALGEGEGEMDMALHEAALAAYAAQGQWSPALAVLERLRTGGHAPSPTCFNHAVQACCLAGEWERGAGLLRRMEAAGHTAGEETYLGVLQALGKAGQWHGALRLLEQVANVGVTPAMARAAAGICVRAHKYAEARALVDRAVADAPTDSSPELLELGLWALVAAPPPAEETAVTVAEKAAGLIQRLMALPGVAISLDAYEHACQALALSPDPQHHETLLRTVHAHAVAQGVIPSLDHAGDAPMDLRGLKPALARVALAEALQALAKVEEEGGGDGGDRPPLVLITGTGPVKAHARRFLRSKGCFDPPFNPLPMPYNHGRLLLPWGQIRRWQAAGARVQLASAGEEDAAPEAAARRRRERLWGGMDK